METKKDDMLIFKQSQFKWDECVTWYQFRGSDHLFFVWWNWYETIIIKWWHGSPGNESEETNYEHVCNYTMCRVVIVLRVHWSHKISRSIQILTLILLRTDFFVRFRNKFPTRPFYLEFPWLFEFQKIFQKIKKIQV